MRDRTPNPDDLLVRFGDVRRQTESLAAPLSPEDALVQPMPDASPTKWHLAHTTWFFETFLLSKFSESYRVFDPNFSYLFNSYYNAVGERIARSARGTISRPKLDEVRQYRQAVDECVSRLISELTPEALKAAEPVLVLGLNHEQQHQELILTDIKYTFGTQPFPPAYRTPDETAAAHLEAPLQWYEYPAGVREIGQDGAGFMFDNESPRHPEYLAAFRLASRLVTNGEYQRFIDDGGYDRPELWLSDGWETRRQQSWRAPLYWQCRDGAWGSYSLEGSRPVDPAEPVVHVSYFEADAYARWAGARLATEAEWETASAPVSITGNFLEAGRYHPRPVSRAPRDHPAQMYGDVWEWTQSAYLAYPGYRPAPGALGEYNGKFMCNQFVLRGGSCATPRSHIRPTYRNFFPPSARWQFTGIRLASDG